MGLTAGKGALGNTCGMRLAWKHRDLGGIGSKKEEAAEKLQSLEKSALLCPVVGKIY